MRRKQGKFVRQVKVFGSAFGTTGSMIKDSARPGARRWWLIPLIVFLCINGMILTLAAGVQALSPFVYSIF